MAGAHCLHPAAGRLDDAAKLRRSEHQALVLDAREVPEHAPFDDTLIAEANHAAVVTRNVRQSRPLGVACLNPWGE